MTSCKAGGSALELVWGAGHGFWDFSGSEDHSGRLVALVDPQKEGGLSKKVEI